MSDPSQQHADAARAIVARCAVITLSDTRTESSDTSGATIKRLILEAAHQVVSYTILPDEPAQLEKLMRELIDRADIDVILTTGGTGISGRDQTVSTIARLFDKALDGFGELFRMLSWGQIGSGAMLSRATGGIARGKVIFAMPGSTKGVELAMTRLVLPELRHLIAEVRKN